MERLRKYKEGILYLFFGVLSTIVNLGTYFIATRVFGINYLVSNVIAWFFAVIFAYVTNKFFVFEVKNVEIKFLIKEFLSFINCRIVSGVTEIVLIYLMVEILCINDFIVKIITNIVVVVLNFIFSKLIIFKKKTN
ncbi:GtrA family protein [Peptacetobacter hiranonis]|uniref:GtrA family protein n=1 Tax=Peptacetobacter hiranonis TaxID=89152 RepID=UPI002E7782CB|nr:GtrA family protein [Peptacetobacter hiranonis]MEE0248951.1 GtrA family protein [Peptacetobacter hiranonis]